MDERKSTFFMHCGAHAATIDEAAFVEMVEAIISFFEDNSKSVRRRNAILIEARALLAKVQA